MSGIEVAGLVLGAFPLLLEAVDRYQEGAERLSTWWRFRDAYKKSKQDLMFHKLVFEQILSQSLLPLIVDDDSLQQLMANPGGTSWRNNTLESRLKERLASSYDLYMDYIKEVDELMRKLKEELGVERKLSRFEYESLRLKFPFSKTRDKLFDELKEYSDRLRLLLELNEKTQAIIVPQAKSSATVRATTNFWRQANRLYELICHSWKCSCMNTHYANLLLHTISSAETSLDLVFMDESNRAGWEWQKAKIKRKARPRIKVQRADNTEAPVDQPFPFKAFENSHFAKKSAMKKSTVFQAHTKPGCPTSTTLLFKQVVSWEQGPKSAASPQQTGQNISHKSIEDMCRTLYERAATTPFRLYDDNEDVYYDISPLSTIGAIPNSSDATLHAILQAAGQKAKSKLQTQSQSRLSRRDRYRLAFTTASAYLQLGPTAWLATLAGSRNIHIYNEQGQMQTYVRCDFASELEALDQSMEKLNLPKHPGSSKSTDTSDNTQQSHSSCGANNQGSLQQSRSSKAVESLPALGIVLLELCFGETLEDYIASTGVPQQSYQLMFGGQDHLKQLFEHALALQWSKQVLEEAGLEYETAVDWCLKSKSSINNFAKDMISNVIEPLEYCYRQLCPENAAS